MTNQNHPCLTARAALIALVALGTIIVSACSYEPRGTEGVSEQDMVLIPDGAIPLDRVRIDYLQGMHPLNRRMVLSGKRRPYLLVFKRPCYGINRMEPIVIDERSSYLDNRLGSLQVNGASCFLDGIYQLTPDQRQYLMEFFP